MSFACCVGSVEGPVGEQGSFLDSNIKVYIHYSTAQRRARQGQGQVTARLVLCRVVWCYSRVVPGWS